MSVDLYNYNRSYFGSSLLVLETRYQSSTLVCHALITLDCLFLWRQVLILDLVPGKNCYAGCRWERGQRADAAVDAAIARVDREVLTSE